MKQITLGTLKCNETEDWGADECRLDISIDGVLQPYLRRSLNDGQRWRLNRSYRYSDNLLIRLWDEDSPDADDRLGTIALNRTARSGRAKLTGSGAEYVLSYSIEDVPNEDPVQAALERFEQSSRPGKWRNLSKQGMLDDIRDNLAAPESVRQNSTPLCGPAAIVYELVRKRPERYVAICQELYETGQFRMGDKIVKPNARLLGDRQHSSTSEADWMLLATMRDAENAVFKVRADASGLAMNIAGITTPWEMKGWAKDLLGYQTVSFTSTFVYGEFDAMREAQKAVRRGGVAFPMIHSDLVRSQRPTLDYPDHWVVYTGGLDIDEGVWYKHDSGRIKFDCFSWRKIWTVNVDEGAFEDGMFGVVIAY